MSQLLTEVRRRASDRCEYCLIPQSLFSRAFHTEHIIAKQHGGATDLDNLALACWQCNLKKGPNLTGIDPETNQITRLFRPRKDNWADHFSLVEGKFANGAVEIFGLTPVGRATANLLEMNEELRQAIRYELLQLGAL